MKIIILAFIICAFKLSLAEETVTKLSPQDLQRQLHQAASINHTEKVETLTGYDSIKKRVLSSSKKDADRVDVNVTDERGKTALHKAALNGSTVVASVLVEAGAEVNVQDENGRSPLHDAALSKKTYNAQTVRLLIENGADIHLLDKEANTALHLAVSSENKNAEEIIIELIKQEANINAQNKKGQTPLHIAAQWRPDLINALRLVPGVNLSLTDNDNKTFKSILKKHHPKFRLRRRIKQNSRFQRLLRSIRGRRG